MQENFPFKVIFEKPKKCAMYRVSKCRGNPIRQKKLFIIAMCICGIVFGTENEPIKPNPIGNFSVPLVTQLAPLVSFGQLLIGEKALLSQFSGTYTRKRYNSYETIIVPNIIY